MFGKVSKGTDKLVDRFILSYVLSKTTQNYAILTFLPDFFFFFLLQVTR